MDPYPPGPRFGPHTEDVEAFIEQASRLTRDQLACLESSSYILTLDESGPGSTLEPTEEYVAERKAWARIAWLPDAIMQSLDDPLLAAELYPDAIDRWWAALHAARWCHRAKVDVGTAVRNSPGVRTMPRTASRYLRTLDSTDAPDLAQALVLQDRIRDDDLDLLFGRWRRCVLGMPSTSDATARWGSSERRTEVQRTGRLGCATWPMWPTLGVAVVALLAQLGR